MINNTKKILFLINKFKRGGAERAFSNQINELHIRGYDVYLGLVYDFLPDNSYFKDLTISADKIINFSFSGLFDFKKLFALKKFVINNDIDAVYSTLESANIISRLLKIISPCSRFKAVIRESGMADRKNLKNKSLDLMLNFFTDKIIAVSEEVKNSLVEYQNIHSKKIIIIENGVPAEIWDEIRKKRNKLNKEEENYFTIINVGSMENENKGQGEILDIFKEIADIRRNCRLILTGDGTLKEKYIDFVKKNNLENQVVFTGYINSKEINDYYLMADLFILFSKNEGCPNAVLEAMSYGLPVISTKVGGVNKIIEDGKSGYLIDRGDREKVKKIIEDLMDNEILMDEISYNAHQRIRDKYSIKNKVDELIKIL